MSAAGFVGLLGGFYAVLRVAHGVADYWGQTQAQADGKGGPGWAGRGACIRHCATHVLTAVVFLAGLAWCAPGPPLVSAPHMAGALAVIGVTHYFADRRAPLRRLACWVRRGRGMEWIDGGGLAFFDQEWHRWWLLVAAAILTSGVPVEAFAGG